PFTKTKIFLFILGSSLLANAQSDIDIRLKEYIDVFKFKPLVQKTSKNPKLFMAGKIIFEDKILSGNRNISCKDCHDPAKGTSDNLPLALGEGFVDNGIYREQGSARIIRRNSPHLYNLKEVNSMFWD